MGHREYSAISLTVVVSCGPCIDLQLEDMHREHHARFPLVKDRQPVKLSCRHPQKSLRVDPHRVDPKQSWIVKQSRDSTGRRNLEDALLVGVTHVDVPSVIDGCSAGRWSDRDLFRVLQTIGFSYLWREPSRFDFRKRTACRLIVEPATIWRDFQLLFHPALRFRKVCIMKLSHFRGSLHDAPAFAAEGHRAPLFL
jgi:hypothetical protein